MPKDFARIRITPAPPSEKKLGAHPYEGLKTIGAGAFYGCTALNGSITIPASVVSVYEKAFFMCSSLVSVTVMNCNIIIGGTNNI